MLGQLCLHTSPCGEDQDSTQSLNAISVELFTTFTLETESREIKTQALDLDPASVHQLFELHRIGQNIVTARYVYTEQFN